MKARPVAVAILAVSLCCTLACESPVVPATDAGNDAGRATTESMCTDGLDDDDDGLIDCDDPECEGVAATGGACLNDADLAIYRDLDGNAEWNRCVPPEPTGRNCLTGVRCNMTCLHENTGLSLGCSRCFAEFIQCFIIGGCASSCGGGGGTPACAECVRDNCGPDYESCFGTFACPYEHGCGDTVDNDGDGLVDAADPDCE